jgi:lipopolysaccharide/colanic/teichoic acid biosynthesis glycosyltransferase
MLFAALAIKATSPGPIIFKQGLYKIGIQQEYTPSGFRSVAD